MRSIAFRSLPNIITIGRLFLVPVILVLVVTGKWWGAFGLFVIAGVSDALDGWLARTFNLRTKLGAFLDPMADKALLGAMTVALAVSGVLPWPLACLIVMRDVMILAGIALAWGMARPIRIAPLLISKLNTAAQILLVATLFLLRASSRQGGILLDIGFYLVATLTLLTTAAYLFLWTGHMNRRGRYGAIDHA